MDKELEEILIVGFVAILFLKLLGGGTSASALQIAKIDSATNTAYADDAADVIGDFAGMW